MHVKENVNQLVLAVILLLAVLYAPLSGGWDADPQVYYFFLAACCLPVLLLINKPSALFGSLTKTDMLMGMFGGYIVLRQIACLDGWDNDYMLTLLAAGMVYVFCRQQPKAALSMACFMMAGMVAIEILFCLPFLYKSVISGNSIHGLQGTLKNSGVLGIFCSMGIPSTIYLWKYYRQQNRRVFSLLSGCLTFFTTVIIFYVQSRTAMLMLTAAVALALLHTIKHIRLKKRLAAAMAAGILVIAFVLSITFKQQSATGRILIWNVSKDMFLAQPLFGVGPGEYAVQYLSSQGRFLARTHHQDTILDGLAGDNYFAFNEFIQTGVELGIVGLTLLVLLIFYTLYRGYKENTIAGNALADTLVILCIGALFGYPLHIIPIILMMVLVFAGIDSPAYITPLPLFVRNVLWILIPAISACAACFFFRQYSAHQRWSVAASSVLDNERYALKEYKSIYPALSHRGTFLYNYGAELYETGRYEESLHMLQQAAKYFNHTDLHLYLAKAYERNNMPEQAISTYRALIDMVPGRFYPRYFLAKCYVGSGNMEMASATARQILSMPVKVPSNEVTRIKEEMKQLLSMNK